MAAGWTHASPRPPEPDPPRSFADRVRAPIQSITKRLTASLAVGLELVFAGRRAVEGAWNRVTGRGASEASALSMVRSAPRDRGGVEKGGSASLARSVPGVSTSAAATWAGKARALAEGMTPPADRQTTGGNPRRGAPSSAKVVELRGYRGASPVVVDALVGTGVVQEGNMEETQGTEAVDPSQTQGLPANPGGTTPVVGGADLDLEEGDELIDEDVEWPGDSIGVAVAASPLERSAERAAIGVGITVARLSADEDDSRAPESGGGAVAGSVEVAIVEAKETEPGADGEEPDPEKGSDGEVEAADQASDEDGGEGEEVVGDRLDAIVESLLLAAGTPLTVRRMCEVIRGGPKAQEVRAALKRLQGHYGGDRGIHLLEVAGGYQLRTAPANAKFVRALLRDKPARLGRAALETLSIIAYKQPVTRGEIEAIRGVDADSAINTLLSKKLAKIDGRKETVGRPLLYSTTPEFLELFGLKDLKELPTLKEIGPVAEPENEADIEEDDIDLGDVEEAIVGAVGQAGSGQIDPLEAGADGFSLDEAGARIDHVESDEQAVQAVDEDDDEADDEDDHEDDEAYDEDDHEDDDEAYDEDDDEEEGA